VKNVRKPLKLLQLSTQFNLSVNKKQLQFAFIPAQAHSFAARKQLNVVDRRSNFRIENSAQQ
jgi:hypothetical protein